MACQMEEKIKATFPFPVKVVESGLSEHWRKLGVKDELFVLVRPDNYIAYICDSFDETQVKVFLEKYFH